MIVKPSAINRLQLQSLSIPILPQLTPVAVDVPLPPASAGGQVSGGRVAEGGGGDGRHCRRHKEEFPCSVIVRVRFPATG